MNKENLLKLADFLDTLPPEKFDMQNYRAKVYRNKIFQPVSFKEVNDCGTVGCALGWGPFVKGLEPTIYDLFSSKFSNGLLYLDFVIYGERVFGVEVGSANYEFMFSEQWSQLEEENTPKATSERIRKVVEGRGLVDLGELYAKLSTGGGYDTF